MTTRHFIWITLGLLAALLAGLGLLVLRGRPLAVIDSPWPPEFVAGHVLVKPWPGIMIAGSEEIEPLGIYVVSVVAAAAEDLADATLRALSDWQQSPTVEWAELDYVVRASFVPNDEHLARQWALPKVQAFAAWDVEWGDATVVIGVVDTGASPDHPDLAGKLRAGKDYVNGDDDPRDDHGHGTHVAGIAAAATNNERGVAGTCPGCSIMPVKVLDSNGAGSYSNVSRGITWAAGTGARVINLSLGGPAGSQTLADAIKFARERGVVIVAAAGNAGTATPQYPAAYPGVIAVAATDQNDRRTSFSSFGGYVAVAAPGLNVISTCIDGDYCYLSGTSMASPHVAGLAGLLVSHHPQAGAEEIRAMIEAGADKVQDAGLGAGRINAARSLYAEPATPPAATATTARPTATPEAATPTPAADTEARTLQLINEHRAANGLPALKADDRLTEAARRHSRDMAVNGYCGHFGTDGSDPYRRMRDAGYNWPYGEIVACGYTRPEEAVAGWKASPAHNAIVLCRVCADFGAGVAGGYYTVTFGRGDPAGPTTPAPTATARPTPTPRLTPTPAIGFWLWCWGEPLQCEERAP